MQSIPQALIIRHRKENLKKCSLRSLEQREDMHFLTYPFSSLPPLDHYVMLVMEGAPILSEADHDKGILLLDSTWRYLPKMVEAVEKMTHVEKRCLPGHYTTAYPRDQKECVDPMRGLSSVEALYISYRLMGRNPHGLLDHYYWKDQFIELNSF
jgi:pre-rRNA-processing protein TSR3